MRRAVWTLWVLIGFLAFSAAAARADETHPDAAAAVEAPDAAQPQDLDPRPANPSDPAGATGSDEAIDWGDDWEEAWDDEDEAAPEAAAQDFADRDPFEPVNRQVFAFNQGVDRFLLDPVSRAYRWVMPDPAERGVRNFFRNLEEPAIFVNDLLQLEFTRAATSLGRFTLNSTVGLAGVWDPAERIGWQPHRADFGQTMALIGIPSGPYLVVPILGPGTVRHALGTAVDRLFVPQTYFLGIGPQLILGTGDGISLRAVYIDVLAEMRKGSVDYYATLRSLYLVNRAIELRKGEGLSDEEYEKVLAFGL